MKTPKIFLASFNTLGAFFLALKETESFLLLILFLAVSAANLTYVATKSKESRLTT